MKIYLSGPIDLSNSSEQTLWRNMIKQVYPQYTYLDPMIHEVELLMGKIDMHDVILKEKADIQSADVLLAYPWKPSSGTAMEVMWAYSCNLLREPINFSKPIAILTVIDQDRYISPWVTHHSTATFHDFKGAFDWMEANVRV